MPAAARITINDGKATPTAHNFDPTSVESNSASFGNASASTLSGRERLSVSVRPASGQAPGKVSIRLTLPVEVAQTDGTVLVTQFQTGICEFLFHGSSTSQMRKDARVLLANALAHATIVDAIENVNPVY